MTVVVSGVDDRLLLIEVCLLGCSERGLLCIYEVFMTVPEAFAFDLCPEYRGEPLGEL